MPTTAATKLRVGLAGMILLMACSPWSATPTTTGHDAYPYTSPTPPYEPTPIDGVFARRVTSNLLGPAGGCRRCPPYRLAVGAEILGLRSGTFRIYHAGSGYMSVGHYQSDGEEITFFNDPNCPQDRGMYTVQDDGDWRTLVPVDDPCAFDRVRERFLSAAPWHNIDLPEGIYEASTGLALVLLDGGFSLWEGETELAGTVAISLSELTIDVDGCSQTYEWSFRERSLRLDTTNHVCDASWTEILSDSVWSRVG